jgi:hypothetical protein
MEEELWLFVDQVDVMSWTAEEWNIYQKMRARMKKYVSLRPLNLAKYWIASVQWWTGWKESDCVHLHLLHLQNIKTCDEEMPSAVAPKKISDYFKNTN